MQWTEIVGGAEIQQMVKSCWNERKWITVFGGDPSKRVKLSGFLGAEDIPELLIAVRDLLQTLTNGDFYRHGTQRQGVRDTFFLQKKLRKTIGEIIISPLQNFPSVPESTAKPE